MLEIHRHAGVRHDRAPHHREAPLSIDLDRPAEGPSRT
jgi:hypothetical protein